MRRKKRNRSFVLAPYPRCHHNPQNAGLGPGVIVSEGGCNFVQIA